MKVKAETASTRGRLDSIQVLRALAASGVVVHHFCLDYRLTDNPPSFLVRWGIGDLGASGVDIFFVISGFIMMYSSRQTTGAAAAISFLKKRALRIYPMYWIATALAFAAGERLHRFGWSFVAASFWLVPWWSGFSYHPLLTQGWTLQFEMLFYLVFTSAILIGFLRQRLWIVLGFFGALALAGLLFPPGSAVRYLLDDTIVLEFLYGILVARIYSRYLGMVQAGASFRFAAPALLTLGGLGFAATLLRPGIPELRCLYWGVPAFLLVLGAVLMRNSSAPKFLVYLGNASYSMYLFHGFFRSPFGHLIGHRWATAFIPPDLLLLCCAGITVLAASSAYLVLEKPMIGYLLPASKPKQVLPQPASPPVTTA